MLEKLNKKKIKTVRRFIVLALLAVLMGGITGIVGTLFKKSIKFVSELRNQNPIIILLLPMAAITICCLYKICKQEKSHGTNIVLESVRSEDSISGFTAPLMFISTIISHMFGASVGCEGAALQIGGGIGENLARMLKINSKSVQIVTMCGMSGCFAALFGAPVAAAVFVIEVISVGVMYYSALVPCFISSVTAHLIAYHFGIESEIKKINLIDNYEVLTLIKVAVLACVGALVSILFCKALKFTGKLAKKIENIYLRALILSSVAVLLIFVFGADKYAGTGMSVINRALSGDVDLFSFAIKIVITSICISAGLKGGEIIPSFFIGATFGCMFGSIIGLPPEFAACIGILSVFCGVTNCPIATFMLSIELFGAGNAMYFFLAIAISYALSGYYGLYSAQKIVYSKYLPEFINIHTK